MADVHDIKFVVNFDFPNNTEDYIHRIGRTARAEQTGTAYSFFTSSNAKQSKELIEILKEAKQSVPPRLYQMLELSKQIHLAKTRQRFRVRDEKRRNEDRAGSATTNGHDVGGYSNRSGGGATVWADSGGDKGYLGGLGKYNHKKDATVTVAAASNALEQNSAAYSSGPAYTYNPQTNSVTPSYMTTDPYAQQYAPYQNGSASGYSAYTQPGIQYPPTSVTQPTIPPQPPQQMYYPPPPPPPPPGQ